ncbi:methyltransferase domain-containing protein [Ferruginibacter sp. HRS2-29]|uniref:methyltransferase domain-containing protein n=1 Tax=Ferruginibacter sp. HRS2-29 TaxID=2487334 RepID=UPI0020CFD9BD|nr:methyltransferase domain-containing protein [Ferruginibacter sp. HRS2-29]MCP9749765.1 methyltransferase domain-containing protein [Ferruginibacter sp. HRS2-29]
MVKLSTRSNQKEILDRDDIPFEDIRQNMRELNTINSLLGGHRITLTGIRIFVNEHAGTSPISFCEIGCGGGDNLNAIYKHCRHSKNALSLTGIDIKKECIDFAQQQYPAMPVDWLINDYRLIDFKENKPGVIFSSLFCHHFTEEQLVAQLQWMKANCRSGFFINDLHRNVFAYYSIKWLTKLFSRSYLVKNDAPLSVARGFTKSEWKNIFTKAGISNYKIRWKWAFRHLIIFKHA